MEGYDIFGKNELFAPRIKWEALKTVVEGIKNTASEYERGYNDIRESIESKSDFQQVDIWPLCLFIICNHKVQK